MNIQASDDLEVKQKYTILLIRIERKFPKEAEFELKIFFFLQENKENSC